MKSLFSNEDFILPTKKDFLSFYLEQPTSENWNLHFSKLQPENFIEFQWLKYFQGLHHLSLNQEVDALESFKKIYHQGRMMSSTSETHFFQLMGLALTQMSRLYRVNGDFEKAYIHASIAFEYFNAHGNIFEKIHAAFELEFLAIHLKDFQLSLLWAQKSEDFCFQLPLLERRISLLCESFLKTAESLRALGLIFEAEKKAGEALDLVLSSSVKISDIIENQKIKIFQFLATVHTNYSEQAKNDEIRRYHEQKRDYFLSREKFPSIS